MMQHLNLESEVLLSSPYSCCHTLSQGPCLHDVLLRRRKIIFTQFSFLQHLHTCHFLTCSLFICYYTNVF
ncbi:hypothetical protein VIGAN_06212700 [Vigna angularis var. angularis]|uniref:Uncharacterized protein n=1 Tax=Vigna angularis var. angularis TaxID=157739 RepID=A0A0S3SDA4_PHAAN|nr:hypothetical protein VIGAN_06212700 [Vigna angularis var. angularis]